MFLTLRVRPRAKKESLERISETEYRIDVKEPPKHGRANARVRSLLAKAFCVAAKDVIVMENSVDCVTLCPNRQESGIPERLENRRVSQSPDRGFGTMGKKTNQNLCKNPRSHVKRVEIRRRVKTESRKGTQ